MPGAESALRLHSLSLTYITKTDVPACVCAVLSESPPGFEVCAPSDEADLAEVAWFAEAVPGEGISNEMSVSLGCPQAVFKRAWQNDPTGNPVPIDRLARTCKIASLPHCSHSQNLVVVSRFASFLQEVPSC